MAADSNAQVRCTTCGAKLEQGAAFCGACGSKLRPIEDTHPNDERHDDSAESTLPREPDAAARSIRRSTRSWTAFTVAIVALPLGINFGPDLARTIGHKLRPFPSTCGINEELDLTGNFEGAGTLITGATNCTIRIHDAKLKGTRLVDARDANVKVTLVNVTAEMTDEIIRGAVNTELTATGSSLTAGGNAVEGGDNMTLTLEDTTLTSGKNAIEGDVNLHVTLQKTTVTAPSGTGIKSASNLKVKADASTIHGVFAIEGDVNLEVTLQNAATLVGEQDGIRIRSGNPLTLNINGAKIEGGKCGIRTKSAVKVRGRNLNLKGREAGILSGYNSNIELDGGTLVGEEGPALALGPNAEVSLSGTQVSGAEPGIEDEGAAKVSLSNKAAVSSSGDGIRVGALVLVMQDEATVTAEKRGVWCGTCDLRLSSGARVTGKNGGIEANALKLVAKTGTTVDGGAGAGVHAVVPADVILGGSTIKGAPGLSFAAPPATLDREGAKIDGRAKIDAGQKIGR